MSIHYLDILAKIWFLALIGEITKIIHSYHLKITSYKMFS